MDKTIKVNMPSGVNEFKALCAYKNGNDSYVVLDLNKKDANEYSIVLVCQFVDKNFVEFDDNKWNSEVKPSLISAVKGDQSVEYIAVADEFESSENIGHPISLREAHIEALKANYVVKEENEQSIEPDTNSVIDVQPENEITPEIQTDTTQEEQVSPLDQSIDNANTMDLAPIIEEAQKVATDQPVEPVVDIPVDPNIVDVPQENDKTPVFDQPVVADALQEEAIAPVIEEPAVVTPLEEVNVESQPALSQPEEPVASNVDYMSEFERIREEFNTLIDKIESEYKEKKETADAQLQVANIAFTNAQNVMNPEQPANEEVIGINDYQPEQGPVLEKVA